MHKMPNDINARISKFAELCVSVNQDDLDISMISELVYCDKICYYPDVSEISVIKTFKVPLMIPFQSDPDELQWQLESLKSWLDKRWLDNRQVLCFLSAFMSPTIYSPTTSKGSNALMIRGAFITVNDNFILPKIIDRNKRIDTILDETK